MRKIRAVAAMCLVALTVSACATEITGTARIGENVPVEIDDDPVPDPVPEEPAADEPADDDPVETAEPAEGDRQPGFGTPQGPAPETSTEPIRPVDPNDGGGGTDPDIAEGASADWLRVFCSGMDELSQYGAPDVSGQTDTEAQETVIGAYDAMANTAAAAAETLEMMPPPGFDTSVAIDMTGWLWTVDEVYYAGARRLESQLITDDAEFAAAIDEIESGLDDANVWLSDAINRMDESSKELLRTLPECAFLTG